MMKLKILINTHEDSDILYLSHSTILSPSAITAISNRRITIHPFAMQATRQCNNMLGKTPAWNAVFAIPELRSHVAVFLRNQDIMSLIQSCRHWSNIWYPELFIAVDLHAAPSPHVITKLRTYGRNVRSLELKYTDSGKNHASLLSLVPNLRSLDLKVAVMCEAHMEAIVSLVPDLRHVGIWAGKNKVNNGSRTFVHLARLPHLQSLNLANDHSNFIHTDDVLHVLKACPQLTSVYMQRIQIADPKPELVPEANAPLSTLPVLRATFPIANTDTETLQVGRRIHKFHVVNCGISDAGLLRILGTDGSDGFVAQRRPLVEFELGLDRYNSVTSKSVSRILSECHVLETFILLYSKVLLKEIFQESQPWPFAKTLREFVLRNDYPGQVC